MKTNIKNGNWMKSAVQAICCLALVLVLALGLLPGMTQTAEAADSDILYVGDKSIDLSLVSSGSGDGWSYANNTLTLTNCALVHEASGTRAAISYEGTQALTIKLVGTNAVTRITSGSLNISRSCAMYFPNADITITGDGELTCIGGESKTYSYGIYANNLTMNGGKVTASGGEAWDADNGESYGLYARGSLTLQGDKTKVTVTGGKAGSISAGVGSTWGVSGSVRISGGTVEAVGGKTTITSHSTGINLSSHTLTIENGITSLTAAGNGYSITGNIVTKVAGNGWSNTEGTAGDTVISASAESIKLDKYKEVKFPASVSDITKYNL